MKLLVKEKLMISARKRHMYKNKLYISRKLLSGNENKFATTLIEKETNSTFYPILLICNNNPISSTNIINDIVNTKQINKYKTNFP